MTRYQYFVSIVSIACASLANPLSESATSSLYDNEARSSRIHSQKQSIINENGGGGSSNGRKSPPRAPFTKDERNKHKKDRSRRIKERRENAREKIKDMIENPHLYAPSANNNSTTAKKMTAEEIRRIREEALQKDPTLQRPENQWIRRAWGWGSSSSNSYEEVESLYVDSTQYYDSWAQGYRMLGSFISCDLDENNEYNYDYGGNNCVRWVLWAAYLNPNYQGGGRSEYFQYDQTDDAAGAYYNDDNAGGCYRTDDGSYHCNDYSENNDDGNNNNGDDNYVTSSLDCHDSSTEWELMGIYRQDFYEFFEQIVKHVWYYDDYEYIVGSAGLEYMGDNECSFINYDGYGNEVYSALRPMAGGNYSMGLYSDWRCLTVIDEEEAGYNYDTINNGDYYDDYEGGDDDYYGQSVYNKAQEYTLTLFNEVFEEFKYCTLCMDYPSYQDGYFNGDYYGTDDDNLINQCWKFYSHDTYVCDSECVAMAHAQETIVGIKIGDIYYGAAWEGEESGNIYDHYKHEYTASFGSEEKRDHVTANLFFLLNLGIFSLCIYIIKENGGMTLFLNSLRQQHDHDINPKKMRSVGRRKVSKNKKGWFRPKRSSGSTLKKKKSSISANTSGLSFPEMLRDRSSTSIFSSLSKKFSAPSRTNPNTVNNFASSSSRKKRVASLKVAHNTSTTRPGSASSRKSNYSTKSKPRIVVRVPTSDTKKSHGGIKGEVITIKVKKDNKADYTEREGVSNNVLTQDREAGQDLWKKRLEGLKVKKDNKADYTERKSVSNHIINQDREAGQNLWKKRLEGLKKKQSLGLGTNVHGKGKNKLEEKKLYDMKKKLDQKKKKEDNVKKKDEPKKKKLVIRTKKDDGYQQENEFSSEYNEEAQAVIKMEVMREELQNEKTRIKDAEKMQGGRKKTWRDMLKWRRTDAEGTKEKETNKDSDITEFDARAFMTENVAEFDAHAFMTENVANDNYHLMTKNEENSDFNNDEHYQVDVDDNSYENYPAGNEPENYPTDENYPAENEPENYPTDDNNPSCDYENYPANNKPDISFENYLASINYYNDKDRNDNNENYQAENSDQHSAGYDTGEGEDSYSNANNISSGYRQQNVPVSDNAMAEGEHILSDSQSTYSEQSDGHSAATSYSAGTAATSYSVGTEHTHSDDEDESESDESDESDGSEEEEIDRVVDPVKETNDNDLGVIWESEDNEIV